LVAVSFLFCIFVFFHPKNNNYEMSRKIEDFGQVLDEFFPIAIIVNFSQNSVE